MNTITTPRIYRPNELLAMFGITRMTLSRWVKDNSFPQPLRLGPRKLGWLSADVDTWLAARRAQAQEAA